MPRARPLAALVGALLAAGCAAGPRPMARPTTRHRFAVIGHGFADSGEAHLKRAIEETGGKDVDFVVVTGIKGGNESLQRQAVPEAPRADRRCAAARW